MGERLKRFPGFIGGSHETRSQRFSADKTVNMIVEISKQGAGKGDEPAYLFSAPGLRFHQTVGAGPIRAVHTASNQDLLFVVSGNEVYRLEALAESPVLLGEIGTSTGLVSIADNGIQVLLVDGQHAYYNTLGEDELTEIDDPNCPPADIVSYQDGYFILNKKGTAYFFLSDLYSVDFPELNAAAKAGNPDLLIAAFSHNRELYLLGAKTLETWYNAGASGITPFVRQNGRFSQVGCLSPGSIARVGEGFFWLGTTAEGDGVIFALENGSPKRISTHAIEFALQQEPRLNEAVAYAYLMEGHLFYILNIPGCRTTYCYDLATGQWAERQSIVSGLHGRHLGQVHCLFKSQQVVGDYRNGKLYTFDLNTYTDAGEPRLKSRQAPHVSDTGRNIFVHLLEIDAQFGVGLTNAPPNTQANISPTLTLEVSRDGGKTFGNPITASLGKLGDYRARARFSRLGYGRDLIFRISTTDSVDVTLLSAWLDLEVGTN